MPSSFPVELKITFALPALDKRDAARRQQLAAEKLSALLSKHQFASVVGADDSVPLGVAVAEAPATAAPAPAVPAPVAPRVHALALPERPRVPLADSAARLATVPVADAAKDLYPACDEVAQYSSAVLRAIPLPSAVEAHVGQVERVAREALEKARQQGAASGSAEMAGA